MNEYVGVDVSKEETSFCVMNETGRILAQGKVPSDPESLFATLKEHTLCPGRIVLETGTLSNWLARGLRAYGLPVIDVWIDRVTTHRNGMPMSISLDCMCSCLRILLPVV